MRGSRIVGLSLLTANKEHRHGLDFRYDCSPPQTDAINAEMIVDQWRGLHGVGDPDTTERVVGHVHRTWHDAADCAVIEEYVVAGMGHGTPLATRGDEACGSPGPHMLDAGISSTYRIAAAWGIVPAVAPPRSVETPVAPPTSPARFDPAATINDALRAAGLIRP